MHPDLQRLVYLAWDHEFMDPFRIDMPGDDNDPPDEYEYDLLAMTQTRWRQGRIVKRPRAIRCVSVIRGEWRVH